MNGYSVNNPWIAKREPIVCLWKPDYNRGFVSNMNTSLLVDVMCFSDRQLEEYALMMKACGFTGVQVTDMCTAWRHSGSPEFVHDRLKVFANALHKHGMEFSLWAWAAEFSGHGWQDEDVYYCPENGGRAIDDPKVRAAFEKYYDIYAEMAPYTDRVIAHYYDPGNLPTMEDVIDFLRLFADKFKAANPNVQICVDTWGSPSDFPDKLVEAGFDDIMLMELPFLPNWSEEGKRARFREGVKALGCGLGSWGWYTCEYEIDQHAMMSINNRVLKDVYKQVQAQGDHVMIPSYWSEMDSYHVLNFFSLYAAGHLLTDPDADPDELLAESAVLLAGDDKAAELLYVLELIRDARSGDSWATYWWTHEDGKYNVLFNTDPVEILERAEKSLVILDGLVKSKIDCPKEHFPLKPWQIMKLMMPHVEQIKKWAEFRIAFAKVQKMYESEGGTEAVRAALADAYRPIPEYNCIVGLWGQVESVEMIKKVEKFCRDTGIPMPRVGWNDYYYKRRIVDYLTSQSRQDHGKRIFRDNCFYEAGLGFGGYDETKRLVAELVREGVLVENDKGEVALANADAVKYDFNI